MGVINDTINGIINGYNSLLATLPPFVQNFLNLFLLVLIVTIYAIFIWKFYKFISKKNILELNLNKYNKYQHPFLTKLVAGLLYLIEYVLILPFLVFIWFSIFTIFLIVLSETPDTSQILIIAAVVIASIRMTSYYKEEVAAEVAKFLPITLLAISILNPSFFTGEFLQRTLGHFAQIPGLLGQIANYLVFIIILEIILRFFEFIFSLFGIEEETSIKAAVQQN